jgi:hypothetical protein
MGIVATSTRALFIRRVHRLADASVGDENVTGREGDGVLS